jgi:diguanylate cyclase (GGDEF)-like protein/excisionase family DNA binding protein
MKGRLGEVPLEVRQQIAAAVRDRARRLASDLAGVVGEEAGLDLVEGNACAAVLLSLLAIAIEAGLLDARREVSQGLARFSPALTIRQLVRVAHGVERGVLDELALHDRLGATSERWPMVAYAVRSAALEIVAAFAECEAARTAIRDPLTTLLTAELFKLTLARELVRALRHGHGVAVILFDIDNLARLNRVHGYGVGDRLLERLGILGRRFFRTHDWVARHGGDSVAALLPETRLDQAAALADRFREMVEQRLVLIDHKTEEQSSVTVSAAAVGTDLVQAHIEPGYVMAEAEAAMMRAKLNGRNRVERVALLPTSVTILGAATLLGVTAREVVQLIRRGALPASRRGRHYHIDRAAIEDYKGRR